MKKYTEEELKQIFKNRSNCYADSNEVIIAMDKDRFIEVLRELKILPIQNVSVLFAAAIKNKKLVRGKCADCEAANWGDNKHCIFYPAECKQDIKIYVSK